MNNSGIGSKDGQGAGDHDQSYTFGRHPLSYLHVREYARLLVKFPKREVATHGTSIEE